MSELKSRKYADKHGLADKLKVDAKTGEITPSDDYYEATLEGTGVTLDQLKKVQKNNAELLSSTTLVAGEMAAEHFKDHPETSELSLRYSAGHDTYAMNFSRAEDAQPVRHEISIYGAEDKGELKKVKKLVQGLFDEI